MYQYDERIKYKFDFSRNPKPNDFTGSKKSTTNSVGINILVRKTIREPLLDNLPSPIVVSGVRPFYT